MAMAMTSSKLQQVANANCSQRVLSDPSVGVAVGSIFIRLLLICLLALAMVINTP